MGKIIYICHRWHGDHKKYEKLTKKVCRHFVVKTNNIPLSTALYINQFLDDNKNKERKLGIALGHKLMKICDIVYSYEKNGISDGMKQDKKHAKKIKKKIEVFKKYPWE